MRNESGDGPFTVMDGFALPMLFPPACKGGQGREDLLAIAPKYPQTIDHLTLVIYSHPNSRVN